MMKGKSQGGVVGTVASSTLAYPGNSFKYSPKFSTDESQQKLNVFGVTTVLSGAAATNSPDCSTRLANTLVVPTSAEKNQNKLAQIVSEAGFLQRQSRHLSQECDEIHSLSEDDTEKVKVEVVQKVEKDIQETEHSFTQQTKDAKNGKKTYKN